MFSVAGKKVTRVKTTASCDIINIKNLPNLSKPSSLSKLHVLGQASRYIQTLGQNSIEYEIIPLFQYQNHDLLVN